MGRTTQVLEATDRTYEIILIDDGSTDGTFDCMRRARGGNRVVRILRLRSNFGQTAALAAGFDFARGDVVIAMDGDMQHAPEELPRFLSKMDEGYDLVSGWRVRRSDPWLTRRLPSRVANFLMARLSGVRIHDFGTTYKAYRSDLLWEIQLYGDLHRFIPVLAAARGARITEIPIENPPRASGRSNYRLSRAVTVLFDLQRLWFLLHHHSRPLQFFGAIGMLIGLLGAGGTVFLAYEKFARDVVIMVERGPLFMGSIFLMVVGIQFVTLGILGEMILKLYQEQGVTRIYSIREALGFSGEEAAAVGPSSDS